MSSSNHPYRADLGRLARTGEAFARLVESVGEDQWDLPTPCEEWAVRSLVAHVATIVESLVPLATGAPPGQDIEATRLRSGVDVAREIRRSLGAGIDAWNGVHLSELRTFPWGTTPAVRALQFTIVELTGHGWDLATALGATAQPVFRDDDLEAVNDVIRRHLVDAIRPGLFDPAVPLVPGASLFDTMAALLGRAVGVPAGPLTDRNVGC